MGKQWGCARVPTAYVQYPVFLFTTAFGSNILRIGYLSSDLSSLFQIHLSFVKNHGTFSPRIIRKKSSQVPADVLGVFECTEVTLGEPGAGAADTVSAIKMGTTARDDPGRGQWLNVTENFKKVPEGLEGKTCQVEND